ncbi:phosphotyrosine protein phosphatases I [Microthyrium microscopicum]|uniref:Phosphotyrosine protein phosphatases I n=1 Tax=Microthyrium microscopicum TaxID=703497 RepID=A0A6A6UPK3_9PEZI|nr:phosphotyrosine protein phosphatases I [Microthyrium microscopicum]
MTEEETTDTGKVNVLFVCLGNICRSPMAEAVFRHIAEKDPPHPLIDFVDSAGTAAYHTGSNPDPRTTATLDVNGIDDYEHAARQVSESDFEDFQYILGMDRENVSNLKFIRARLVHRRDGDETGLAHVGLFGDYGGKKNKRGQGEEVEDPYYGGDNGFKKCYEQMNRFSIAFLQMLEQEKAEGRL